MNRNIYILVSIIGSKEIGGLIMMEQDKYNVNKMDKKDETEFIMDKSEIDQAKSVGGFYNFWSTKKMNYDEAYKFRILDEIKVRDIDDKYAGKPTTRMCLDVAELKSGLKYTIACQRDKNAAGNFPSLTLAMRRFYAMSDGNVVGKYITVVKRLYKHEKWGDTDGFNIDIVEVN